MTEIQIDTDLLERFELGLDPAHPERSEVPAVVLGYGEISTVLAIGDGQVAYKRMPMFADEDEITAYAAAFDAYLGRLQEAGIRVTPSTLVPLQQRCGGRRKAQAAVGSSGSRIQRRLVSYAIQSSSSTVASSADDLGPTGRSGESKGRHVDVDRLIHTGRDSIGLMPDANIGRVPHRLALRSRWRSCRRKPGQSC